MQLLSELHYRSKIIFYLALVVCIVGLLFIWDMIRTNSISTNLDYEPK